MLPEHRMCTQRKVVTVSSKLINNNRTILQVKVATIGIMACKHQLSAPNIYYQPLVDNNILNIGYQIEALHSIAYQAIS